MKDIFKSKKFQLIGVALVVVILFGLVYELGYANGGRAANGGISDVTSLTNKETGMASSTDFSLFWQVWNILDNKYVATHSTSTVITSQDRSLRRHSRHGGLSR